MNTDRLYYSDPYRRTFQAQVTARTQIDGLPAVTLNRTAFFPTGGGQPHDLGRLNEVAVQAVHEQEDQVWHLLAGPLAGDQVSGEIDWSRRRDHMQNHSGQHILSQALVVTAKALTVAWRLSPNSLTIDLERNDLDDPELERAERLANAIVQDNRPISARFVTEAELAGLALRKQPQVEGALRVVEIADFDRVACSGLHVSHTAQVGLIKVLRAERRGAETRIHFACGGRAVADYRRKHQLVRTLAARFTRGEDELPDAVDKLAEEAQAARRALREAQDALVDAEADRLWRQAQAGPPPRLVRGIYAGWEGDQVKRLALALRRRPGCIIALAGGDPPQLFCTRSNDVQAQVGQALHSALTAVGGRGGGRSDFAQGGAPTLQAAEQAIDVLALHLLAAD